MRNAANSPKVRRAPRHIVFTRRKAQAASAESWRTLAKEGGIYVEACYRVGWA